MDVTPFEKCCWRPLDALPDINQRRASEHLENVLASEFALILRYIYIVSGYQKHHSNHLPKYDPST